MTPRLAAIVLLASRMEDAPNFHDYCEWLSRQSDELLFALADGKALPFSRLRELAA